MTPIFSREQLYNNSNKKMSVGLFKETALKKDYIICTLVAHDPKLPRLIDYYTEFCVDDPTEYNFALAVFGNWEFWVNIKEKVWFKEYYIMFKEEAEVKRKALAFGAVINEVKNKGTHSLAAAKFLIQEPWKDKTRYTKTKANQTTKRAAESVSSDLQRLIDAGLMEPSDK